MEQKNDGTSTVQNALCGALHLSSFDRGVIKGIPSIPFPIFSMEQIHAPIPNARTEFDPITNQVRYWFGERGGRRWFRLETNDILEGSASGVAATFIRARRTLLQRLFGRGDDVHWCMPGVREGTVDYMQKTEKAWPALVVWDLEAATGVDQRDINSISQTLEMIRLRGNGVLCKMQSALASETEDAGATTMPAEPAQMQLDANAVDHIMAEECDDLFPPKKAKPVPSVLIYAPSDFAPKPIDDRKQSAEAVWMFMNPTGQQLLLRSMAEILLSSSDVTSIPQAADAEQVIWDRMWDNVKGILQLEHFYSEEKYHAAMKAAVTLKPDTFEQWKMNMPTLVADIERVHGMFDICAAQVRRYSTAPPQIIPISPQCPDEHIRGSGDIVAG